MISQRDQQSGFSRCEGCKYDVCRTASPSTTASGDWLILTFFIYYTLKPGA